MEHYRLPARDIPVYGHYDVVVVGGGCAGFAAAIASARNGANTLILERFPFFGGTATASLMANIVGFRNQVEPNDLQVCKGIGEELMLRLLAQGDSCVTKNAYKASGRPHTDQKGDMSYSYTFRTEAFKRETLAMVRDAGADILFHVYFSQPILEENRVVGVVIETKQGAMAVYGDVVIDATGDGDVASRAGAPYWQTRGDENKRLHDTLMYKVSGFDPARVSVESCVIGNEMILWGPDPGAHDACDPKELTQMEIVLRENLYRHFADLQKKHPELQNAFISETGPLMGVRQTRFIEGDYCLTGEDVLEGRRFSDVIAVASNPIIAYYGYRRFLPHEGYDIPYRCLLPKGLEGLLLAGRCMSSDQRAFESWRAMAHVLCIGEAAGTAAALAARDRITPRRLDVEKLQHTLIAQDAELGQGRTI